MNVCIAIINIGDRCTKMWRSVFAPSVQAYADRHGYEVREVTSPLSEDKLGKHPAWQKLLIPSHPAFFDFDRIVFLDSDVMCNPDAPAVAELVPDGKIGAVTWQGSYFNDPVWRHTFELSWSRNESKAYRDAGITSFSDLAEYGGYPRNEDWLNSGVLVYSRCREVRELMATLYYEEPHGEKTANEQQALTHCLCNEHRDICHPLDRRFNAIWYLWREMHYPFLGMLYQDSFVASKCVEACLLNSHFLHFAADGERTNAVNFMRQAHLMGQKEIA